ncbi:DUF3048 domain-containing protein [Georgenia satyanarayanai]|uniref:DUF3048 domain-containing protein n=1 Tax=Georgenia satyanarayanai TaxID=860221 RepID=UPI00203B8367|nr:DUF3048 domain-containing protein [Georgenia satyanarayanai]MCM3660200.1 DUF3048 domain-containing protein [Georgenia satyanarayanai]
MRLLGVARVRHPEHRRDDGRPAPEAVPTWPLTGVPVEDAEERPVMAVKVDNTVVHSRLPEVVGPIHSARPMDPGIAAPLGGRRSSPVAGRAHSWDDVGRARTGRPGRRRHPALSAVVRKGEIGFMPGQDRKCAE